MKTEPRLLVLSQGKALCGQREMDADSCGQKQCESIHLGDLSVLSTRDLFSVKKHECPAYENLDTGRKPRIFFPVGQYPDVNSCSCDYIITCLH